jgi:hypothetical protein
MRKSLLTLRLSGVGGALSPAVAQENSGARGTTILTLRPQIMFFEQNVGNEVAQLPGLGVQLQHTPAGSQFGYSGSVLYAEGGGSTSDYVFPNAPPLRVNQDYHNTRIEAQAFVEYTPESSPVTFMVGLRYTEFDIDWDDVFTVASNGAATPVVGNGFTHAGWLTPTVGVRIAGRLGPDSPHALTGQVLASYGPAETDTFYESRNIDTDTVIESNAGTLSYEQLSLEIAFGYSYFLNERVALGVRSRVYLSNLGDYGSTADNALLARQTGSRSDFATEFNISWRL